MKSHIVPNSERPGFSSIIRHPDYKDGKIPSPGVSTLYELFKKTVAEDPKRALMGTRTFNLVTQTFGHYEWKTTEECAEEVEHFGSGLDNLYAKYAPESPPLTNGQQPLGIYSINRAEWLLSEFSGYRGRRYTVALYDTLGVESIEYIVNHAEIRVITCSIDKIPRLLKLKSKLPNLKVIISMDSFTDHSKNPCALPFTVNSIRVLHEWAEDVGVVLLDMNEVAAIGRATPTSPNPPSSKDLSTICYTSGTTGTPKGAMSTHESYTFSAASGKIATPVERPLYLSFLPLAHCYERYILYSGMLSTSSVGFYSGDVLRIAEDAQELKPNVIIGVPRLFNRIYDRLTAATVYAPGLAGIIARTAIKQKLDRFESGGGHTHALWDRLVCNKIRKFFGGRLELLISGSAPIDGKVLNFLRVALACTIYEGYGQTEGNATATSTQIGENKAGHVGVPMPGIDIKLRDVPEMCYLTTDKPCPRGEIMLRGPNVFVGYYKDEERSNEAKLDGWFLTGDIGLFTEEGTLKIIDRRKNIFKLSQGEYIAPEHLETVYSENQLIQQIYVHGESLQSSLVAVVVPDPETFPDWASKITGKKGSFEELSADPEVVDVLCAELQDHGKKYKLQGFEIIKAIYCDTTPFDIETNGILTSTFKLKRNVAKEHYQKQITEMYSKLNSI